MKVLHLIDSFAFTDRSRQLQILGPALRDDDVAVEICCLGGENSCLEPLRRAGVVVHALAWTRWFDPRVLMDLRGVVNETRPDVIHVWGLTALRTLAVCAPDWLARVVLSGEMTHAGPLSWWDRRLMERIRPAGDVHIVPTPTQPTANDDNLLDQPIRLVCMEQSFRHAVWSFDFVRLLYPSALLDLVVMEAEVAALERTIGGLDCGASVRFHRAGADVSSILQNATIVWLPALTNHGRQSALEAMAQGRPVIASDVPCIRELIEDGVTGFLVPPGDVIHLARRTRMLLDDASLRADIAEAARVSVMQRFPLAQAVKQWRALYRSVAA